MKPIVAVSAWMAEAKWLAFGGKVALLEELYLSQIERAGGIPVVVRPDPDTAAEVLHIADALVIGGGSDVDPAFFGQLREPSTQTSVDARQDSGELALAEAALARGLPVLAVCRGCQLLNVLYGGTLFQELTATERSVAHAAGGPDLESQTYIPHRISATPGSRLAAALGEEFQVPSWHHQGIDAPGIGLEAVGRADDGLIEAIEDPDREFVLGVQWHPETEPSNELFEALVGAARTER